MASGGKQTKQQSPAATAADQELDPRYDWQDNTTNFVLRVHLPADFRKQDFKVQVDGAGRLTIRGQRASDATAKHYYRLNKVFQLPATSNLDDITGRFEAHLLTLTVPKKQTAASIVTPAAQTGKQQQPQEPAKKAAQPAEADATRNLPPPPPPPPKEEDMDSKKNQAAAAAAPPATSSAAPPVAADDKNQQQQQQPAAPPPAADKQPQAERKAADPDSLAERVKRRAEEEDSKARPAAAAEEAPRRGFRERVAKELQGLPASEWAEGLVDTVRNNREVIAVAVAAFSIGFFVSSRLFSRASN